MNASGELAAEIKAGQADFDLEDLFRAQYRHIADVIARVVRDPARAEELAVEVFLKLSRNRKAQSENALEGTGKHGSIARRFEWGWKSFGGNPARAL